MTTKAETYEERLSVHGPELAFDDDGVDLTLIRRSLDMMPIERLRIVEGWARAILRARIIGE
jgi:hypothetical protein